MSNIPSTLLDDMDGNASARHVVFNENMDAISPAGIFGRKGSACIALTWAYYGGIYNIAGTPTVIADGALALTDNATCYVRVALATGVVDFATSAPSGWPGPVTGYTALYEVTTLAGVVTASIDYRVCGIAVADGNAATATKLQTARTIDGVSFDGTANITVIAPATHAATGKTTPVDADELPLVDSAASNVLKKLTWANLKATAKAYFDTLYQPVDSDLTTIAGLTATTDNFMQAKSSAWASRTVAQVRTDLQGTGSSASDCGFRGIPPNSQSADYTTVLSDNGKVIYHPAADTTARTWTIDSHSNVAWPDGAVISFDNAYGAGALTIAITTDTLELVGAAGLTGTRSLASGGLATARFYSGVNRWRISGTLELT